MNTRKECVIEINQVSKEYQLGSIGHGTLYRDLQSWWAKLRGKDDPNAKIYDSYNGKVDSTETKKFLAIDDLSLKIYRGDIVGIVGKNGAGKSTLLKLLSRITTPTTGNIKIRGRVASLLEVGTGFHSELTGRENVYLNGTILGMTRKEISNKFDEIVAFAELEQFIDTPVKRYSSGMTVRLAFSVAAHLDSEILLVDEVLAVGDISFRKKCMGKMQEISTNSHKTLLFVSHDMGAVQHLCTTGILLDKGKLQFQGAIDEVIQKYISSSVASSEKLDWNQGDKNLPFEEVVRIRGISVRNPDGSVANNLIYASNSYLIQIDAELLQRDSRLMFIVSFYSTDGTMLFSTNIHDTGGVNFSEMSNGLLTMTLPFPVDLLRTQAYELELQCCLHHVGWILPPGNESRMRFDFIFDNDKNPYVFENRLGMLAPTIEWSIKY